MLPLVLLLLLSVQVGLSSARPIYQDELGAEALIGGVELARSKWDWTTNAASAVEDDDEDGEGERVGIWRRQDNGTEPGESSLVRPRRRDQEEEEERGGNETR